MHSCTETPRRNKHSVCVCELESTSFMPCASQTIIVSPVRTKLQHSSFSTSNLKPVLCYQELSSPTHHPYGHHFGRVTQPGPKDSPSPARCGLANTSASRCHVAPHPLHLISPQVEPSFHRMTTSQGRQVLSSSQQFLLVSTPGLQTELLLLFLGLEGSGA